MMVPFNWLLNPQSFLHLTVPVIIGRFGLTRWAMCRLARGTGYYLKLWGGEDGQLGQELGKPSGTDGKLFPVEINTAVVEGLDMRNADKEGTMDPAELGFW
jgi:hypothetical protein